MTAAALLASFFALSAFAATPRADLPALTAQLQKSPSDDALRERIVVLGATLKPAPEIPKEARRPFVMAATFQKEAKSPEDYAQAIKAYQDALAVAPWWGDAYYNLSVVLESAKRYDEAKKALKLYLLTKPKDAQQAEDRLYALEARESLAEQERTRDSIVPGERIGALKMGMSEAQATAAAGAPSNRETRPWGDVAVEWGTRFAGDFDKVTGLWRMRTGDASLHLSQGVSVGSTPEQVAAALGAPHFVIYEGTERNSRFMCYRDGVMLGYNTLGTGRINMIAVFPREKFKDICK